MEFGKALRPLGTWLAQYQTVSNYLEKQKLWGFVLLLFKSFVMEIISRIFFPTFLLS